MIEKAKSVGRRIKEWTLAGFTREEGGKRKPRWLKIGLLTLPLNILVGAFVLWPRPADTSFMGHTSKSITPHDVSGPEASPAAPHGVAGQDDKLKKQGTNDAPRSIGRGVKMNFHAVQVVQSQSGDPGKWLPIGTSFIGRLLTGIDTREANSIVRVLAPYGASFDHERNIERNAVLFGNANYPSSGEKVYVKFTRLLTPDGKEYKIDAQALSSADYSPGLSGDENDGAGGRIFAETGLTMLSGMSDVLVQKESLGQYAEPTAKANLKNGFFNGFSKATQEEVQRRAAKINDAKDYVTIPAGMDVIVSLTETFKGETQ